MKIGKIGSGVVAETLAQGFLKFGYETMISSRSAEKRTTMEAEIGNGIKTGDFNEAASFGDTLVLALKGTIAKEALQDLDVANLSGKVIMDATNPISDQHPPEKGVLRYFTNLDRSLMEDLQETFPQARFVKAFSMIGSLHMVNPDFEGGPPSMFICGNDDEAKHIVTNLLIEFGFEVEDFGAAEAARAIEPLAMLWCIPGFLSNNWNHAIKLIKK
jgi:predicted dinucleotide-binding enzyme